MAGLVLGGGGARCFAHLGVLRALEEREIEIDAISGCSTAALISAFVAAGYRTDEILALLDSTSFRRFLKVRAGYGLFDQTKLGDWLQKHLPERFEDLQIPLGVVAVDIQQGSSVHLTSGPLIPALLASQAFPGFFRPIEIDGRLLVDGGILEQVPVSVLRELSDAFMIAVEVHVLRDQEVPIEGKGLRERIAAILDGRSPLPLRLLYKASAISRSELAQNQYQVYPPGLILRPPIGNEVRIYDFGKLRKTVGIGYREAVRVFEQESRPAEQTGPR